MEQIPTAEEFLDLQHETVPSIKFDIRQVMIEFAKLHVEAALKAANEEVIENDDLQGDRYSGRHHMKNCYPLENIK
jgi:hypothetical protein